MNRETAIANLNNYVIGTEREPRSLFGLHDPKYRYAVASLQVTKEATVNAIRDIDRALAPLVPLVVANVSPVLGELSAFSDARSSDPIAWSQQCIAFAILSPGCKLDRNALAVRRFWHKFIGGYQFTDINDLYETITDISDGLGPIGGRSTGQNARSLFISLDGLATIDPSEVTKPGLLALRKRRVLLGIGQKTSAMASALNNEHYPTFTLDIHMLRLFSVLFGWAIAGTVNIDDSAYPILETALLEWIDRNFGKLGISPFAVQWTLWNLCGFGHHASHLPIFGLQATE